MGAIRFRRLSAATIVETLVAMVIIFAIFGIATTVFVQVSLHAFSVKKQKAVALIDAYAVSTGDEHSFFEEEITRDGLILKKVVIAYPGNSEVASIGFQVFDSGNKLLASQKRLFRIK